MQKTPSDSIENLTLFGGQPKIGWIGTGIMGRAMVTRLLKHFYVRVYSRTYEKAKALCEFGADLCESPWEVACGSDILFFMLGFPDELDSVLFNPNNRILESISPGGILVDMSTGIPSKARCYEYLCREKKLVFLDAPVSGGEIGAINGTLSIMIGGDQSTAMAMMPIWKCMGKTVVYHGPTGSGQHAKMANQTLIAGNMVALCEALLYAYQSGLDLNKVLESTESGAAGSWSLTHLAPKMLEKDYRPGFRVTHFVKDLGIALDEAAQMRIALPGLALARQLYIATKARLEQAEPSVQGTADGTQALIETLAEMSHVKWEPSR